MHEEEELRKDEALCRRGVKPSTAKRYAGALGEWLRFLVLKKLPEGRQLHALPMQQQRRLVVRYIRHLFECAASAASIGVKLAALAFALKVAGKDVAVFDDPTVALARRAILPNAREESLRRERRKRMPVTFDMTEWARVHYWRDAAGVKDERAAADDRMTYIGIVLAFAFLWRVSQYVLDSQVQHAIMAEDVNFFLYDKTVRCPWEMAGMNPARVESILFVSRSSKNDKAGRGKYMYLQRKSPSESQLLETVVQWCSESGVRRGDPLLCRWYNGKRKLLTRKMVNNALKVMAAAFGYDTVAFAFSSHSLRIGGATSMMAAGVDKERVRIAGGWAEGGCDEIYELANPLDDNALSIASSCFRLLTVSDVEKMLPPAKRALLR